MATIANINVPDQISLLNPNAFLFGIQKYPELNYFMQQTELPGMNLGQAQFSNSIHDLKMPGETLEFQDLTIQFLVDSKIENYMAIHDWMTGLGYPEGNTTFGKYLASKKNTQSYTVASKTVSDCFLHILDSNNLPLMKFTLVDAFPTSLTGISMASNNSDVNYVLATLTLAYSYYTVG
jgi:hypothetical protein